MDKICLVFDIDETLLRYQPKEFSPQKFEYEENLFENDKMVIRPGLEKFIDFVNSNGEKIILGIWTYGTKEYAEKVVER
jgi:predicted secreted acid phosphatase